MDKTILDCTKNNRELAKNRFFLQGDPEAILMIENLGNPDLIFKAKIFSAKLAFAMKKKEKAKLILQNLVKEYTSNSELGDIHFWLYQITQQEYDKNKSLAIYQKLYAETPLYLFEERIKELS